MRCEQRCPAWGENGVGRIECDPVRMREKVIGTNSPDRKRGDLSAEVAQGIDLPENEGVRNCRIMGAQVGDLHSVNSLRIARCSRSLDHCSPRIQQGAAKSDASGRGTGDVAYLGIKLVVRGIGRTSTVPPSKKGHETVSAKYFGRAR